MRTTALICVTAVWGWTFVLVKEALVEIGPFLFLTLRFALAAIFSLFLWRWSRRGWLLGAILGVVLFCGYFFQTWGLVYTTAQKSGLITGLSVVLVPPLALLFGRRTEVRTWIGVVFATLGLCFLILGGGEPLGQNSSGDFLTFLCSVAFALHIVLLRVYAEAGEFEDLLFPQYGVVALLSLLGTLIWEEPTMALSCRTWYAIAITGTLATAVAYWVLAWVEERATAAYTAIVLSTEPAFAALFGWLLLGETLGPWQLLGAGLIILGIALPNLRREQAGSRT